MNGDRTDPAWADPCFDRLVDGELDERQRRELLAGLENEPGGWRRCALAFLESQCWKEAFRRPAERDARTPLSAAAPAELAAQPAEVATRPAEIASRVLPDAGAAKVEIASRKEDSHSGLSRWAGRFGTLAAMAASFLVALSLGSLAHRTGPPIGLGRPDLAVNTGAGGSDLSSSPWGWVTVSAPGNGTQDGPSIQVPAVASEGLGVDEQWLRSMPPAIPDNVLQALTRTGHQVQQQRRLVPLPLKDGRQLIVPVDQVELHYVGNGTY
jgi:hypothetical protein